MRAATYWTVRHSKRGLAPPSKIEAMPAANPDDLLTLELIIEGAESAGKKSVTLETRLARLTLELAKRARKEGPGGKAISGRAKVDESLIIWQARQRKADLAAQGIPKEQAEEQAANEAAVELSKQGHNLAPSTIRRRMQRRL